MIPKKITILVAALIAAILLLNYAGILTLTPVADEEQKIYVDGMLIGRISWASATYDQGGFPIFQDIALELDVVLIAMVPTGLDASTITSLGVKNWGVKFTDSTGVHTIAGPMSPTDATRVGPGETIVEPHLVLTIPGSYVDEQLKSVTAYATIMYLVTNSGGVVEQGEVVKNLAYGTIDIIDTSTENQRVTVNTGASDAVVDMTCGSYHSIKTGMTIVFDNLPLGNYAIQASRPGYKSQFVGGIVYDNTNTVWTLDAWIAGVDPYDPVIDPNEPVDPVDPVDPDDPEIVTGMSMNAIYVIIAGLVIAGVVILAPLPFPKQYRLIIGVIITAAAIIYAIYGGI